MYRVRHPSYQLPHLRSKEVMRQRRCNSFKRLSKGPHGEQVESQRLRQSRRTVQMTSRSQVRLLCGLPLTSNR